MWPILGVRAPKGASDNSLYNLFFGTISFHQKTSETCKNGFLMLKSESSNCFLS